MSRLCYPTEFLLPQLKKHITLEEFPFVAQRRPNPRWDERSLKAEILRLGHWEYHLSFEHGLDTGIHGTFNDGTIDFHRYRSKLISETIAGLVGVKLADTTIIDLASHCGVFSMDIAYRGAKSVLGVEYREKNLNQARFLKDYYQVERVDFEQGDIYDLGEHVKADVVMCLGLLYHVVRPIEVVELCYERCRQFAVIETVCHKQPLSGYVVVTGKNPLVAIEGTRSIELQPTYRGIIDTIREAGFKSVVEVVGTCDRPIDLFSDNTRRCFIAFKEHWDIPEGCLV
jgi:tRNA (mo5U34)-methyltransferase